MTMLVVLFNLKPGVDAAVYEQWARTTDLPTVKALGSVSQFQVLRSQSVLGSDAKPPFQYIELLDVSSMPELFADIGSPTMQRVAAEFQSFADQPIFIVTESL
jgi:hypothetical protein